MIDTLRDGVEGWCFMFGSYHLTRHNIISDNNRQVLPVDKSQAVDENDGDYLT